MKSKEKVNESLELESKSQKHKQLRERKNMARLWKRMKRGGGERGEARKRDQGDREERKNFVQYRTRYIDHQDETEHENITNKTEERQEKKQ